MNKSVLLLSVLHVFCLSHSRLTLRLKSHSGIYSLGDVLLQSIRQNRQTKKKLKKKKKIPRHTLRGNRQKWGAACNWYCVHFKYWCQRSSLSLHVSLLCSRWRLSPPQNGCQPCTMSGVMTGEEAFPDGWSRVVKSEAVETNTVRSCCAVYSFFLFCFFGRGLEKAFLKSKVSPFCASPDSTCIRSWAN